MPGVASHPIPRGGRRGCPCRTPGQRPPAESGSARAPVPRGWPGPGSPSSPAAALNQTGLAVSAGHVGLTHAANSLTPCTLGTPRLSPTPCQDGPGAPASPHSVRATARARGAAGPGPAPPLPLLFRKPRRLPDTAASPLCPGAQLARGPAPAPALPQQCRGRDAAPHPRGILPLGVLCPMAGVMPPAASAAPCRQRRGSRAGPARGAARACAGCQGTCWDKTCFFQTNLLEAHPALPAEQLARSSLPPTASPMPPCSPGATAGCTLWPAERPARAPRPAAPAALGVQVRTPGHCP